MQKVGVPVMENTDVLTGEARTPTTPAGTPAVSQGPTEGRGDSPVGWGKSQSSGFESGLCPLLAVQTQASVFTSLCLRFLTCLEMRPVMRAGICCVPEAVSIHGALPKHKLL